MNGNTLVFLHSRPFDSVVAEIFHEADLQGQFIIYKIVRGGPCVNREMVPVDFDQGNADAGRRDLHKV